MVGSKEYYIEKPYTPCFYNAQILLHLIDTRGVAKWQEVANALGISCSNLLNSLLLVTRLPLTRFLVACELYSIEPFCAIIDSTPPFN